MQTRMTAPLLAAGLVLLVPARSSADASIRGAFKGSEIIISTERRFAGAISSLTWSGVQFIDSYDHGRELQSASSFDDLGECYNPTEAGSSRDRGKSSTSSLQFERAHGNVLHTKVRMAFWLQPGERNRCPGGLRAQNPTTLSRHTLEKIVTLGAGGIPNAIEHAVTFSVPESRSSGVFEALTGYMPETFSSFWSYDPVTAALTPLSDGPGEQTLPVILATPDGAYAMGVYSPDVSRDGVVGYGRWRFTRERVVKWNCVFRERTIRPGDYSYTCYSVVGSLSDVTAALSELHARVPTPNRAPIGSLDAVRPDGLVSGWALDPDTAGSPIAVYVYLDGPAGSDAYLGTAMAASPRPDVNDVTGYAGDHGFEFQLPAAVSPGRHAIYIYGVDSGGGNLHLLTGAPKAVVLTPAPRDGRSEPR